jgi:hypothetical protein
MPKVEAICEHLHQCQRFLFLIDHAMFSEEEQMLRLQEWRYARQMYQGDSLSRLAVVNYDHLRSRDVPVDQISAFLNVGLAVDFSNRNGSIFDDIKDRLGLPKEKSLDKFCEKTIKPSSIQIH